MDRVYQITINETRHFNLAAFDIPSPPTRIMVRYLVAVDRPYTWCSTQALLDLEPLDAYPEWDGDEPGTADQWREELSCCDLGEASGADARTLIALDPCVPRWYQDHAPSTDPADPIQWGLAVVAAAYQGNYADDCADEPDPERARLDQAREDAHGNPLV